MKHEKKYQDSTKVVDTAVCTIPPKLLKTA